MSAGRATLSVVVVASNEASRIARCFASASFADERLLVDTGSTDDTMEIARAAGFRVEERPWQGFGPTKAAALAMATGDWVLLLDADEAVTPELRAEIEAVLIGGRAERGFELCRRAFFLGRWMAHGGYYPDWVLRLVQRDAFEMSNDLVHERLRVDGAVGRLAGDIEHYTDRSLAEYLAKMVHYASLGAESAHASGRRFALHQLVLRPPAIFLKRFVLKLGCLDGMQGFLLALLSAVHVTIKYARLWELGRESGGSSSVSRALDPAATPPDRVPTTPDPAHRQDASRGAR